MLLLLLVLWGQSEMRMRLLTIEILEKGTYGIIIIYIQNFKVNIMYQKFTSFYDILIAYFYTIHLIKYP